MATIEEYICQQLGSCLRVKNKNTGMFEDVRDPEDGHTLTKEEGIAMNLVNQALQGDVKAIEYCNRAKLIVSQNSKKKNLWKRLLTLRSWCRMIIARHPEG